MFFDYNCSCICFQNITDRLLLRKNQTSFRGGLIDRNNQHDKIRWMNQITHDTQFRILLGSESGNLFLQFIYICLICGTYPQNSLFFNLVCSLRRFDGSTLVIFRNQVCFVQNNKIRNLLLLNSFQNRSILFCHTGGSVHHQNGNIRFVQNLVSLLDPKLSKFSLIIQTRRINHHNRTERKKLHSFQNRIRCSTLYVRYDRKALACKSINDTRFAGITFAKNTNMDALRRGRII